MEVHEDFIIEKTRKLPRFWKFDAAQELRLTVLECVSIGIVDKKKIEKKLKVRLREVGTVERNHGGTGIRKHATMINLRALFYEKGWRVIDEHGFILQV